MNWFVPSIVIEWKKLGFQDADGALGFMPVFDSIEKLRAVYPREPYMCITAGEKVNMPRPKTAPPPAPELK